MALIVRPATSNSNQAQSPKAEETTQLKHQAATLQQIQLQNKPSYNEPLQEQGMLSPHTVYLGNIEDQNVRSKHASKETPTTTECSTQLPGYQPGSSGLVQPGQPSGNLSRQTNQSVARTDKSPEKDAQMKQYMQRNAYYFTGKAKGETQEEETQKQPKPTKPTLQSEVIEPGNRGTQVEFYGSPKAVQKIENLTRDQGFRFESQLA